MAIYSSICFKTFCRPTKCFKLLKLASTTWEMFENTLFCFYCPNLLHLCIYNSIFDVEFFFMHSFYNLSVLFLYSKHLSSIFAQKSIILAIQNISTAVVSIFMTWMLNLRRWIWFPPVLWCIFEWIVKTTTYYLQNDTCARLKIMWLSDKKSHKRWKHNFSSIFWGYRRLENYEIASWL